MAFNKTSEKDVEAAIQFWLRPENYLSVPYQMAFPIYQAGRMPFRHMLSTIQKSTNVDENFEQVCQQVLEREYPSAVSLKNDHRSWYELLNECQYGDESPEMEAANQVHRDRKAQCESTLVLMDKVSGGDLRVEKRLSFKREMVVRNLRKGVKLDEHSRWKVFRQYSMKQKARWLELFDKSENGGSTMEDAAVKAFTILSNEILVEMEAKERIMKRKKIREEPIAKRVKVQ
uniref:Uncharacterized protein n=1 Tax=Caenorhabditis japonica TaxID=281687 RepID=A0A8R1HT61_CAEJA